METKLATNTFKVKYSDGEEIIVKPSSWKSLEDIEILQRDIVKQLAENDGAFGEMLKVSNKRFWGNAEKIAAMLPVVGQTKKGIDLEKIDSIDDIVRIFITASSNRHPETGGIYIEPGGTLAPGDVCRINGLNFTKLLREVQKELLPTPTPAKKKRTTKKTGTKSSQPGITKQTS